jgi:hypothetical protein
VQQLRALKSVDDLVAALLDDLEQKGEQDTLVIYISDNGYLWGDHGLSEKGAPYDAGAKVPLMMRHAPLTAPGTTDTSPVANIDLAPTALQLAGESLTQSPPLDGQPLVGATPRARMHNEFYDHGGGDADWASTRVPGEYLYIETYTEDGETIDFREYYDLQNDPYEIDNLYGPDGLPDTGDDLGTPAFTPAQLHDQLRRDRMCEGSACPPGPGGGTADIAPPRTLIKSPRLGATVCCRVMLKASATDNVGVSEVEFSVDGNLIGTDSTAPYTTIWENTNLYGAGPHTIEAIAVDAAGNHTQAGSLGSTINVTLNHNGADIQIDDGGVPRTSCGALPPPCNVGSINPGDTLSFTFSGPVAPGSLIPGWDGTQPATCTGDPPPLGCVTLGVKADSQADQFDNDTAAIYSDLAGLNKITALGDLDLGDFDYVPFDTGVPLRTWPRSLMRMTNSNRTVVVTLTAGTGSPGDGELSTVKWTNPGCGCQVWESIDGSDTDEDREF